MADNLAIGNGKRKTSNARVFLRNGNGTITVNGKKLEEYFPLYISIMLRPYQALE